MLGCSDHGCPPDHGRRGAGAPRSEEPGGGRAGSPEATRNISPTLIDVEDVEKALGRPRFYDEAADRTGVPGVATGLAVTGAGQSGGQ